MPAVSRTKRTSWRSAARCSPRVTKTLKRLGRRVRELRAERELTQEEVAEKAKLDARHYQDVEAGKTNATVATLVGLAEALSVSLSELFDGV